jgi:hypothetical protein
MAGTTARDDTGRPDSTPDAARRGRIVTAIAMAAVIGAGLWLAFDANRSEADRLRGVKLLTLDRPFPAGGRYPSDPYVGPEACAECHPGPSASYLQSGHGRTLRSAGERSLARRLDGMQLTDPEHPGARWAYHYRDGQLHIDRTAEGRVRDFLAQYAFGSGHHATTFVSVLQPEIPRVLEHRITYFAREQALGLTPGHKAEAQLPGVTPEGGLLLADDARKCFGCHTTQTSARSDRAIDEETLIPNVSCERCHGPGRAHVEAARRGAPEAQLELPFGPGRYTAEGLLKLCGTCHRHPSRRAGPIRADDPHMARFQPVGLLQSRCFRESGGAFSCVTCHDPHARASTDRASYLSVCLSCHAPAGSAPPPRPADATGRPLDRPTAPGHPCPLQPRGDCVECHMPRVDAGQHVLFADHWIRVRRPGDTAPRGPAPIFHLLDAPEP